MLEGSVALAVAVLVLHHPHLVAARCALDQLRALAVQHLLNLRTAGPALLLPAAAQCGGVGGLRTCDWSS